MFMRWIILIITVCLVISNIQQIQATTLDDLANIKEKYDKSHDEVMKKKRNHIEEIRKLQEEIIKLCQGKDTVSQMALQGRYISAFEECRKNMSPKECVKKIDDIKTLARKCVNKLYLQMDNIINSAESEIIDVEANWISACQHIPNGDSTAHLTTVSRLASWNRIVETQYPGSSLGCGGTGVVNALGGRIYFQNGTAVAIEFPPHNGYSIGVYIMRPSTLKNAMVKYKAATKLQKGDQLSTEYQMTDGEKTMFYSNVSALPYQWNLTNSPWINNENDGIYRVVIKTDTGYFISMEVFNSDVNVIDTNISFDITSRRQLLNLTQGLDITRKNTMTLLNEIIHKTNLPFLYGNVFEFVKAILLTNEGRDIAMTAIIESNAYDNYIKTVKQ